MRLSVLGAGYLGAVHATCLAHLGHEVKVFDVDPSKIAMLAAGKPPFYEPGFETFLAETLASGRLHFTDSAQAAIEGARLHFICVGTPQQQDSDAADLRFVNSAFDTIMANINCASTIVGKSTVPVGTAQRLADILISNVPAVRVKIAWNPEFLREGTAIEDTLNPDRLVFGTDSESSEKDLMEVYGKLLSDGIPYVTTDLATAEMVKVAANSFLATKISFINAMAEICEVANADVVTLSRALGYDDRIGKRYLNAGLGFGGGCLPKDIRAFSARAGELGAADAVSFLREIDKINLRRRERVVSLAAAIFSGNFFGKNVAVLGAAFKPDSDDVRDSPALSVAAAMHVKGALVRVHDPQANENARQRFPTLTYCDSIETACADVDLVVLGTEWAEYKILDPLYIGQLVRDRVLIDARNALDWSFWSDSGWDVHALGRGNMHPRTREI
ncbi:UDP-glucose/GDP-mannose dehydrogenase family protein [Mycobacterium hodleri]|uniref:UDP-glucose 6-dehydrogenase n=1 Tax=Mycolicibacterium hodleri TaxID=49897 RepID=A0A544VZJ4_9MYCO|nr:UDP-glucose/GDP-mannose dehydrogenase family protein [Mycolicibacterium hodleri]TQR85419.1 UDP-glucose/GDP-mannose dehydrogenase family protein [Mycolicibacterium hodleri]